MANKKKDNRRKDALTKKSNFESLQFQTMFALKQMGASEQIMKLAEVELTAIDELGLTQDLLDIKRLVDGAKQHIGAEVIPQAGDLQYGCVCPALGISRLGDDCAFKCFKKTWAELVAQKTLTIYYPDAVRNQVVEWAKANGYNTSTFLGNPMIKFQKIFLVIKRTIG